MPDERPHDPLDGTDDARLRAMAAIRAGAGSVDTPLGRYLATAEGVRAVMQDVEGFVGSFADTSRMPADEVILAALPEPEHGRLRQVVNSVIAYHRLAPAEPFIKATAAELVSAALARADDGAAVDLVEAVVDPMPSKVIAHVLGVPLEDQERFQAWSDELLAAQEAAGGTGSPTTLSQFVPEFAAYVQRAIDERRDADPPPDDVVTRFLHADVDGMPLSDAAVRTQTMFLIVAGNETTRNLIGNCLYWLASNPHLYASVRADRGLLSVLVEESLRLDAPVQILVREAVRPTELPGGRPLDAGDRVVLGIASANRDESVYPDPDAMRLDRPRPRDHLAFGAGPHICPGAALARAETMAVLEQLCDQVAAFHLADGFEPQPNPVFWASGHRSLPCLLEPAAA